MENWFGSAAHGFTLFSASHMIVIIIYFIVLLAIIYCYEKTAANLFFTNAFRWSLAAFILFLEISYQTWMIVNGMWHLSHSLPLEICNIAVIAAIIALTTLNKNVIIITYFIAFIPAGLTIMTPDLTFDYPHFRYFHFFLQHIILSCISIYLVLVNKVKITFKITLAAFSALLAYAFVIGVWINPIFDGNYLFLAEPPGNETLIDFLGNEFIYIMNLVIVGFLVFMLSFAIYKLTVRQRKK